MKKFIRAVAVLIALLGVTSLFYHNTFAEGEDGGESSTPATSISISPVNKVLKLEAGKVYDDTFKIMNNGAEAMDFEVYASPYSYTFSDDENEYKLGFSNENAYTQITRWITIKDVNGEYTTKPQFTAQAGETVVVNFRITTPSSIPAGGQYAVLFAHTLSKNSEASGLKTEASPGMVIYGRSTGETITTFEISDLKINKSLTQGEETKTLINATSKVKNTGNVDFMAYGKMVVRSIFGRQYYATPDSQAVSVIPDVELSVSDKWDDTPYFGLFNVTWTVTVKDQTEEISRLVLLLPAPIIVLMILLLTIIGIWITIIVRKRKERQSRFGTA